jgi:hypothetical protein
MRAGYSQLSLLWGYNWLKWYAGTTQELAHAQSAPCPVPQKCREHIHNCRRLGPRYTNGRRQQRRNHCLSEHQPTDRNLSKTREFAALSSQSTFRLTAESTCAALQVASPEGHTNYIQYRQCAHGMRSMLSKHANQSNMSKGSDPYSGLCKERSLSTPAPTCIPPLHPKALAIPLYT